MRGLAKEGCSRPVWLVGKSRSATIERTNFLLSLRSTAQGHLSTPWNGSGSGCGQKITTYFDTQVISTVEAVRRGELTFDFCHD